jgi:hypothetical protein
MNYRSFFKKSNTSGKILLPEGVDTEQLKMGIKAEKEHTKDVGIAAKIALDHLKEDPKYYSKLSQAGLEESGVEEHCGACKDDMDVDDNGGLPKVGGALAVPHDGRPIHMSKIIQIGSLGHGGTGQSAHGNLSGYSSVNQGGVTKDSGGIPVQPDKEPITAGGKKVDSSIASTSVGGQVVPGEGQKQGGPNSQGTIANTTKMNEGKKRIRSMVKEVLKEITFDKKSGKWVRITENTGQGYQPKTGTPCTCRPGKQRDNCRDCEGTGQKIDFKAIRDKKLKNVGEINELGGHYCFKCNQATTAGDKGECSKCGAPLNYPKKSDDYYGGAWDSEGEAARKRNAAADGPDESVDMKMGPSYKVVPKTLAQTADQDWARATQYEPEITEMHDEEEECMMETRIAELSTVQRTLTEDELAELNTLSQRLENFDPDDHERQQWQRGIDKYNRRNPQRFPCPTCKTPNALSADEKKKGYQCNACANAEEGPGGGQWEEGTNESSYKVAAPTQATTQKDDQARTVQTDPHVSEDADFGDEEDFGVDDDFAGEAGPCPECGNTRDNIAMGRTAQCSRCGTDYEIEQDVAPEQLGHTFDPEMSDVQLGKIGKAEFSPDPELNDDDLAEATGGVAQHRSFRTVADLPQKKDARWSDDIDEAAIKQDDKKPKESETVKKIKKGQKTKKSIKADQLKHQNPRTTKSGVHKKDK